MKHPSPHLKPPDFARLLAFVAWMFSVGWGLATDASLEIHIAPKFSGSPIQPGSLRYHTYVGEIFSVTRVSFLISDLALQRTDGSWLEFSNQVAWFDLDAGRLSHHIPSVPFGEYRGLRFHVGLNEQLNYADPAQFPADHPLNPNLNGLHWSWQGGYVFLALEGMWRATVGAGVPPVVEAGVAPGGTNAADSDAAEKNVTRTRQPDVVLHGSQDGRPYDGWSYHLARARNRTLITLAAPFDLAQDTRLELDFDLAALLNAPRPLSFARDGSSTHSREGDPIAASLVSNLPGTFRVRAISTRTAEEVVATNPKPLYLPAKFTPYRFQMSATFPVPDLPRDNPLIEERVALGEALFHETALSRDDTVSCASCHKASVAFSDSRPFSVGIRGQTGARNAMPLFNLAWKKAFFWDGRAVSLREQTLMPIQDHTEMDASLTNVVAKLQNPEQEKRGKGEKGNAINTKPPVPLFPSAPLRDYPALFAAAFGSPEITPEKIGLALETFLLTLTSFDSKFDRVRAGREAFTAAEQRGLELFMTEYDPRRGQFGADCFHCHGGPLFQSQTFANNGLDSEFTDPGRAQVTSNDSDRGKFATPSLRNIALTAPYMHDGRFATLDEVVEHYDAGLKRSATLDPNLAKHPASGLGLTAEDKRALVAFLRTLTDERLAGGRGAVAQSR